ncbi:MAG: chromosome segregation protein SMC [Oscillospiraceae bacterium]|nr:chromosome segregation protein SMC [Oscillospiraceae bacterium]
MYLKSLELQGFKSFPDKIKLDFGKGITAVVGPNGSGKSNIGDAVRWVLGEQSSKTLRGSKMEDVIFAGTQLRKPMGFAAVTLCIVNDKGILNIDAPEVTVTRKLYRSGESEYLINGAQVRLKDVSELFMDTGLGRDGYSIIGQGRVAEIVSSKSGERRSIFEEAAGISKFRFRKAEAQRRLSQAEENILRLTDIISELESRVEPLRKQSEKAAQFIELSDEKKALEITVWVHELSALRERLSELSDKLLINTSEYSSCEADIERLEEEYRVVYSEISKGNIRIEQLRNAILDDEKANTGLHADIAVYKNEIVHFNENIENLEKQMETAKLSDSENRRLTEEKIKLIDQIGRDIEQADRDFNSAADRLNEAASRQEGFEKEFSGHAAELNRLYIRQSELKVTSSSLSNSLIEIKEQEAAALKQLGSIEESGRDLDKERKEVTDGLALLDEKKAEQENRISGLNRLFSAKSDKLKAADKELSELTLGVRDKENRIRLLNDLENSMEGFGHAVKQALKAGKSGRISGIIGSVAQILNVPSEYSVAVETALGGALQNIVTEDEEAAKRSIRMLKDMNAGRATFLPITSVKGNRLSENGLEGCSGFIALGCDVVTYDAKFMGIVNSLLGRTVIAEDIDCAGSIAKKFGYRFKIVTLDGQVVNAGGSFTGGSANRSSGVLTRKNEIERLNTELSEDNGRLSDMKAKASVLKAEVDKMRIDLEAANDELRIIEQDRIRFEAEIKRIEQVARQSESGRKNAEELLGRLKKRYEDAENSAEKTAAELESVDRLIADGEDKSGRDGALLEKLKAERDNISSEMSALKIRRAELEKDREAAKESLAALEEQSRSIGDSSVKSALAIEEQKKLIAEREELIRERETSLKGAGDRTAEKKAQIYEAQQKNLEMEKRSGEIRSQIKDANAQKEKFGAEKTRLEERQRTSQLSYDKIVSDMAEQYELYPSEAEGIALKGADINEINMRLGSVKQKIRSLGTVNLAAIEEYKEVSERYEFMSGQLSDVNSSKRELEKLIDELTETMKKKFSESFDIINSNFKQIFTELFGGGKAELALTDPEDVLESGIEINVAPPGKVIKSLSLLSGGEQAFVAIAIYFAILRLRPAPFCILDEIEAALDDMNVTRYAKYLHNFTDTTQFITVTHRRGTMEEADVMYGVTMQEKGISRLLKMEQPPADEENEE